MELWVRSQDKETLLETNTIALKKFEEVHGIINYVDINNWFGLGLYKTKERALEVLDEIQKKINLINLGHDFGSPMIDLENPTYIYEMPEK